MWLSVCVAAVGNGAEEEAFVRAMLYTVLSVSFETRIILHTSKVDETSSPVSLRRISDSMFHYAGYKTRLLDYL